MSKDQSMMERNFHDNRRKVYKKISKPVQYGELTFPSGASLARYLKLNDLSSIYRLIKCGEYKGTKLKYIK